MKTIVVASGKGGTGKTTVTAHLGLALSQTYRVGLFDLDITGPNLMQVLGLNGNVNPLCADRDWFYPIKITETLEAFSPSLLFPDDVACAWKGDKRTEMIRELLEKVKWNSPDYLLCDSPPSTSDELTAVLKYAEPVGAIIVTNRKRTSLDDAKRLVALLNSKMYSTPILGVIDNMSAHENGTTMFSDGIDIESVLGVPVIGEIKYKQNIYLDDVMPIIIKIKEIL